MSPSLQSLTAAHGALDLLVEFPASPSFEQSMDLQLALEDLLSA